jgi:hypothetical protein
LMIDDFTATILGNKARLAVVRDKIQCNRSPDGDQFWCGLAGAVGGD